MYDVYDKNGVRKYLVDLERDNFLEAAWAYCSSVDRTFCLTLGFTGARLSEVLELTPRHIDYGTGLIVIRCLKKRKKIVYRPVLVPMWLLVELDRTHDISAAQKDAERRNQRIWTWCRTTAWSRVKGVMRKAGIEGPYATARGLRHTHGTASWGQGVPLKTLQRQFGHARPETTMIYTNVVGAEELQYAERVWNTIPLHRKMQLEQNTAKCSRP